MSEIRLLTCYTARKDVYHNPRLWKDDICISNNFDFVDHVYLTKIRFLLIVE